MAIDSKSIGKMTYEDYVRIPADSYRHEIIDGDHFVNPAPSTYHQTVSRHIQFQLYEKIEKNGKGFIFDSPVDVQLSEHDIVQPDLVLILEKNQSIITDSRISGTPDLIVEILSASSRHIDSITKKALYESAKVPEYWIVDPWDHKLAQFVMEGNAYTERAHGEIVTLSVIENVTIDLAVVW